MGTPSGGGGDFGDAIAGAWRAASVGALRAGCRDAVMAFCSARPGTTSDVTHLSVFSAPVLTCALAESVPVLCSPERV